MINRNVKPDEEANIMNAPVVDGESDDLGDFAEAIDTAYREAKSSGKTQYVILCISP